MISNRRITAVSRLLVTALFVLWMLAPRTQAQSAAADITGVYNGSYDGPQGTTIFKLSLTVQEGRQGLTGTFTSHPAGSSDAAAETIDLAGFYGGPAHRFQLRITNARTVPLSKGATLGINGAYNPASGQISGMIVNFGSVPTKFEAARGGTESAGSVTAPTVTPGTPPPVRQTTPAAPSPTTIDGVYNGTYICSQGTTDLKLSLEGSARGNISALFTFYLPPGTQQHGYTYSLRGRYNPQTSKFSLTPVQWETEHPDNFGMVGMNGTASASGLDGIITGGLCRTFHVERNEGESANIAAVIAAQKSVGKPLSVPPPAEDRYAAALRAQAPASARGAYPAPAPPPQSQAPQSQPPPEEERYAAAMRAQAPASARSAYPAPVPPPQPQVVQSQPPPAPPAPAPVAPPPAPPQNAIPPAARQPANATPAAAPPASSGRYYVCHTKDPNQPVAYFSDIFVVPHVEGVANEVTQFVQIRLGFQTYLYEKYQYLPTANSVGLSYGDIDSDGEKMAAEVVALQERNAETDAATAKKQIVHTGWKFTGLNDPVLFWHMESKKDPLTDEVTTQPTAKKFFPDTGGFVTVTANCGNNGVSVFFLASPGTNEPTPQFGWYTNDSDDSGDQVADVRMRVDGGDVHVAQGYPNKEGHTEYTNWLGLLFYSPGLVARVAQNQEDNANTGILALDSLLAPMVRDAAKANAQGWAANSAGPLSNLVNAKSIRIELPLLNQSSPRIVELNPQDQVLHQFVSDCYAGFTSRSQPAPAASPGTRQRYSK